MQNPQSINWLAVLVPSLIAGLFVVLVQILSAFWLSKKTEGYKKDLSKEIENHKKDLSKEIEDYRKDISKELYEFQTRYSLLHQKRAEAIEKLFELLANVQIDLQRLVNWEVNLGQENYAEFYKNTQKHFGNLTEFYDTKRIYFDKEIHQKVIEMVKTTQLLLNGLDSMGVLNNQFPSSFLEQRKRLANAILTDNIAPVMNQLENKFKRLLAAEMPNYQLEKKQ
jgi:hypothetical protein